MECAKFNTLLPFSASVCTSVSTEPWCSSSWSPPQLVIENQGFKSASTGVSLIENGKIYLKWTIVHDGIVTSDEGGESASSWAAELHNVSRYEGYSTTRGHVLLGAKPNTHCTSAWDCNNADLQDWKHIGNYYYAIYNGSNYFRCARPASERAVNNQWALAIRRSTTPLGSYATSTGPMIAAERDDLCGISYPVLHEIGAEIFLYYTYYIGQFNDPNALDYGPGQFELSTGRSIPLVGGFLVLQADGNLVVYAGTPAAPGAGLWSLGTTGRQCSPSTCRALFQTDGNFVLDDQTTPYWDSGTAGQGQRLRLAASAPFLAVLDAGQRVLWVPTVPVNARSRLMWDATSPRALKAPTPTTPAFPPQVQLGELIIRPDTSIHSLACLCGCNPTGIWWCMPARQTPQARPCGIRGRPASARAAPALPSSKPTAISSCTTRRPCT